jgi:plastocyanin
MHRIRYLMLLLAATLPLIATSCARFGEGAGTGRVIEVQMRDDGGRFYFSPENIEVRRGDKIRFIQEGAMPHKVEFVRNTAPAKAELGDLWVGPYLSGRGEVYEVEIDGRFVDGSYDYICAPHAALGMVGKIEVKGGKAASPALATKGSTPASDLPEVRGVHGAQPAEFTMDGDVKVFHFSVDRIMWETKEGKMVEAWAFNRQVPGPTIRAKEGERVRIIVTNNLPEGTTAHWHGLEVPNNMDGVPGNSQDPIAPGESFTYEFVAKPSGTHMYHSHFNSLHQEEHGLYGMFIVEPKVEKPAMIADREEIMILGDGPLGFVINGKEFPMITPITVQKGERIRVRMANLGGLYHPMHLHGGHFTVVAKDGFPVPAPQDMNTLSIAPGETFDVILQAEEPGIWLWHCHVLSHVTGPKDENGIPTVGGMVGVVQVEDGVTELPDLKNHKNH